jgi:hypothetical protein
VKLCRAEEVEQLLCGSPHLDFNELQQSAKYVDYTPDDPIIKYRLNFYSEMKKKRLNHKLFCYLYNTGMRTDIF